MRAKCFETTLSTAFQEASFSNSLLIVGNTLDVDFIQTSNFKSLLLSDISTKILACSSDHEALASYEKMTLRIFIFFITFSTAV